MKRPVMSPTLNTRKTYLNTQLNISTNIHFVDIHEIILMSLGQCIVCAAVQYLTNEFTFYLL
jgi:hypothetical protein